MPMNKKEDTIIATIICQDVFKETKSKSKNKTAERVKEENKYSPRTIADITIVFRSDVLLHCSPLYDPNRPS